MQLSIVVPTLNEARAIEACLGPLQPLRGGVELLVADGGSDDGTTTLAAPLTDRVIESAPGRARQLNAGWRASGGDRIVFLHADTHLTPVHVEALQAADEPWGRFDVVLDHPGLVYRVIESMVNLRSRLSGIATGDQAMFVSRRALERVGGFPEIELMEDVALSKSLKTLARPACLRPAVRTSARRWEQHGVLRTMALMWFLRGAYALGASPRWLAQFYRRAR